MKKIFVVLLVLVLGGCKTFYITDSELSGLHQGLTTKQVQAQLDREPRKSFTVSTESGDFSVLSYQFLVDQRQQMTMICGQYGCTPIVSTEPVTAPYVFAFNEDRLYVWGFVDELKKDPRNKVRRVGEEIQVALQK